MIDIQSLSVAYGDHLALQDITLSVKPGEILALIGPNGAGKSTLIRTVSGVLPMRTGVILIDGRDLKHLSPRQRAQLLAVVPQARRLPGTYTVHQTVLLGRTPYLGWLGHVGPSDLTHVRRALERTQILALVERRVGELSGGEQQRVLLARALAQDTPILLLDEPTAHLDLQHQSTLLNLVKTSAREQGLTVMMAVHDLNLVALYADRVALLVDGRLRALGTPADVLTPENIEGAYKVPVHIIPHPDYGTPLILPDGHHPTTHSLSKDVQHSKTISQTE